MSNNSRLSEEQLVNEQGALALLGATFDFLRRNNISGKMIASYAREYCSGRTAKKDVRLYRKLMRAYEDVGVLMSTWFTNPKFLDKSGLPVRINIIGGPTSLASLVRVSRIRVDEDVALALMRRSPSIRAHGDGSLVALRRVFVLPEFEVLRAALVVERYLDTLRRNTFGRKRQTLSLLERSCHVPSVDLRSIAPILRDIKERGASFMDSVDGQLEGCRLQRSNRSNRKAVAEIGVLVFAWTRPKLPDRKGGKPPMHPIALA